MKNGDLAKATATPIESIRFYERAGLLPAVGRTDGNYRVYDDGHVQRLAFVRHCRSLDMTLDEIRVLLKFKDAPQDDCGAVNDLLDEHIGHVATRMRDLRELERQLKALRAQCRQGSPARECGILNELSEAAQRPPRSTVHVRGTHGRR